jgi:Glycerophosphoryl diester phosphodiesterase
MVFLRCVQSSVLLFAVSLWIPVAAECGVPPVQSKNVAVYDDHGSGLNALNGLYSTLAKCPDVHVGRVKAADIRNGKLDDYDVIIMPGGMSSSQGGALGEDGREQVRTFVRNGGGYIGFCAGAYLATCDADYKWSLNILNAKVVDKEHWARGVGTVELSLSENGKQVLGLPSDRLSVYYHQGPLLAAAGRNDLPAYESWADFETEIAKNGAPKGVMIGTTAVASGQFGGGRVICFSPHPEMTEGLHEIVHRSIDWVARPRLGVEIIAHRGASADAPENTLASLKLAWEQGAEWAECDVSLSKDGHPVLFHDETTERLVGVKKAVAEQTLQELRQLDVGEWKESKFAGERIPTLAQALAQVPTGKRLLVELKCGPEGVPAVLHVIDASGLSLDQLRIISSSVQTITAIKKARPELSTTWVVEDVSPKVDSLIASAKAAGADGVDLSASSLIDRAFVEQLRAAGLRVDVWTVDDALEARRLVEAGVNGITTNRPGWMREQLISFVR